MICIFIYFLTFSSYFTALSAYDIIMSEATAVSFAERVFPPPIIYHTHWCNNVMCWR